MLLSGNFTDQADLGSFILTSEGDADVFVTKLSPSGNVVWGKSWGGTTRDSGDGIAVDTAGNVISAGMTRTVNAAGGINYTGFEVRKFSSTGALTWTK